MQKDLGKIIASSLEPIPSGVLSPSRSTPFDLFACEKGDMLLCSKEYVLSDANYES